MILRVKEIKLSFTNTKEILSGDEFKSMIYGVGCGNLRRLKLIILPLANRKK